MVTVEVFGSVLRVLAEEAESSDRWRGEFSSQCANSLSFLCIDNCI